MSTTATVLQDAIVIASKQHTYNQFELRLSEYSVIQAFKDQANLMLPASTIEKVRVSTRRPVKIPVLNRYDATIITNRSCVIDPDENTSAFKTLSWVTLGFAIGVTPSVAVDNYISEADDLANQLNMGLKAVFESLDNSAYQKLETNKTAVSPSPLYTFANGAYQVPFSQKQDFYKKLPAVMRRHDFNGRYVDIANTEAIIDPLYIQAQGSGNGQNLQYQVLNMDFYRSNRVVTGAGVLETHYDMPQGAIGVYNWIDYESQIKQNIHLGKGWDQYVDPIMGFTWGVFYDHDCVDGRFVKKWNFVADFALLTAYSSNTDTAIVKSEILATEIEA